MIQSLTHWPMLTISWVASATRMTNFKPWKGLKSFNWLCKWHFSGRSSTTSRPAPGCAPCAPAWRPPPVSTSSLPHRSPPPPLLRSMSDTPVTWGHGQMFAVNQCDPARFITVHFRQLTRLVKLMRAAIKNINYLVHKLCSAKTKFLVIPSYYLQFYFIF